MATELLAIAGTAASSSDVTVTDPITVSLKSGSPPGMPGGATVYIELKDNSGAYFRVGSLNVVTPARVIAGPGVYRLTRPTGPAVGAFSG